MTNKTNHTFHILLCILIGLLFVGIANFHLSFSLDAYQRGIRKPILYLELIIIPLFTFFTIMKGVKLAQTRDKEGQSLLFFLLKQTGILITLIVGLMFIGIVLSSLTGT